MRDLKSSRQEVFVAECYAPESGADGSAATMDRVGAACADLRGEGVEVVYLGALIVPDDELAFHLFKALQPGAVQDASQRAGLRVERVVRSVAVWFDRAVPVRSALPVGVEVEGSVADAASEIGP